MKKNPPNGSNCCYNFCLSPRNLYWFCKLFLRSFYGFFWLNCAVNGVMHLLARTTSGLQRLLCSPFYSTILPILRSLCLSASHKNPIIDQFMNTCYIRRLDKVRSVRSRIAVHATDWFVTNGTGKQIYEHKFPI